MEIGVSGQPFQQNYSRYSPRVTDCWAKSLWEKVAEYKVEIELADKTVVVPREREREIGG